MPQPCRLEIGDTAQRGKPQPNSAKRLECGVSRRFGRVVDESVMCAPCELGNEKRRDTPHSKRFATSEPASGVGVGECGVNTLVRFHKKSSRNETISRDTDKNEPSWRVA